MSTHHGVACFLFIYLFHFVGCSPFVLFFFVSFVFLLCTESKGKSPSLFNSNFIPFSALISDTETETKTNRKKRMKEKINPTITVYSLAFFPFRSLLFWYCFLLLAFINIT